jgi:hypothetical protein
MTTSTLHGPGELLASVPAFLGFVPYESVVVVGVRDNGEIVAVMRVDRVDLLIDEGVAQIGRTMIAQLARDAATTAVVISFTSADVRLCCEAADALSDELTTAVGHVETWAVCDGRYFAPGCADDSCCPVEGTPVPMLRAAIRDLFAHPRAQRIGHGSAMPAWGTASADARRRSSRAADRWTAKQGSAARWRESSAALWFDALDESRRGALVLTDARAGKLISAISDVRVRDAVIVWLVPGSQDAVSDVLAGIPSESVADALDTVLKPQRGIRCGRSEFAATSEVISECVARCRRKEAAPLLALLAVVEWWAGHPQAAIACCDNSTDSAPGYRLAELVRATVLAGLEPGWMA